ncbi:MAG: hypothetical protein E7366_05165, partial [Clostridiales bacterium]|nr:hypothetical protein [Clostridiales bacterium]
MRKMKRFTIALLMAVMSFACVLGLSACEFIGNRDQLDNAHEHVFVVDKKTEATCTQDGVTTYKCSHEGCTETKSETTKEALGHEWNSGEVTTKATCETAGVTTYSCKNGCGETKTETGVKANHNVSKVEAVAATCTKDGNIQYYTCEDCGGYFKNQAATEAIAQSATVIEAIGHGGAIHHTSLAPTCTTVGNIEYWECEKCNNFFQTEELEEPILDETSVTIPALKHTYVKVAKTAPTCTLPGYNEHYVCKTTVKADGKDVECPCCVDMHFAKVGDAYVVITTAEWNSAKYTIEAKGHTFPAEKDWTAAKAPTCLAEGNIAYKTCKDCKANFPTTAKNDAAMDTAYKAEDLVVAKVAHDVTFNAAVPHSCTENGNIAYYSCSICTYNYEDEACTKKLNSVVDPKAHSYSELVAKKDATCLEKGMKAHYTCKACDVLFDANKNVKTAEELSIATLDHKKNGEWYVEFIPAKDATCDAEGCEAAIKCKYGDETCGKYVLASKWDPETKLPEWVDKDELPVIEKLPHNYVENGFEARLNVKAAAPTCLNIGIKQYWVCTGACNDVYVKDADGNYVVALQDYDDTTKYADDRYLKDAVVAALTIDPIAHKNADGTMATIHTPGLAATCFVNGNVENWYCTICGRHYANATCTDDQFIDEGKLVINAIAHKGYMAKSPAQPSTCTATGYYEYYTCSYVTTDGVACCDGIYFRDVNGMERYANADALVEPMKAHITTYKAASESSCIAEGNYEYWYCSTCETYYKDEECTEEYTESVVIAKLPHATIQVEGKAATCLESGYEAYEYCTNTDYCNYTTFKAVNAKGHSFVDFEAKAPTCLEKGWSAHKKCYDCEKSFYAAAPVDSDKAFAWDKFDIAPVEHTVAAGALVYTAYAAPTCVDEGNEEFWQCKFCAKYFDAADGSVTLAAKPVIAALGHDEVEVGPLAATCTTPGYDMTYICRRCNTQTFGTKIDPQGHVFELQNAVAPSCAVDGTKAWNKCTNDCCEGKMYAADADKFTTVTITEADIVDAKLGHEFTSFVYNAPKCLTAGNIAYEFCSTCLKMYAENSNQYVAEENALDGDDVTIPATGHALVYVNFKAPTCTEYGWVAHWHCENECGICYEEEAATTVIAEPIIKALGHVGQMTDAVAHTCTANGNVEYWTCVRTYDYDGDGVAEACECCTGKYYATKLVNGVKNADFDNELASIVDVTDGHNPVLVPANAPTCTKEGNVAYYDCVECAVYFAADEYGNVTTTETTPVEATLAALGHVYSYHEAVAATCLKDGNVAYYNCLTCKLYFADEAGTPIDTIKDPAKSHKPQYHTAVAPTCLENGTVEYWTCENAFCDNGVDTMYSDAACTVVLADNTDAAVSHAPVFVKEKAPTCTEPGTIAYYICENTCCDYAAGTMFKEAACETVLPDEDAITDPAIGHAPLFYEAIAPTCDKDGAKAYYTCTNECCIGKAFTSADCSVEITADDYVVPALGHDLVFVEAIPATCLEDGMIACLYCKRECCADEDAGYFAESMPIIPSVIFAAVVNADGTPVLDENYKVVADTTKVLTFDELIVPAKGHDFQTFEYKAPDCTTAGKEAYEFCTNCYNKFAAGSGVFTAESEALENVVIPALTHNFTSYVEGVAPTCTTPGSAEYWYCDVCETRYTDNDEVTTNSIEEEEIYIEALGHETDEVEFVAPTCTEDGNIAHWLCSECGHTYADELGEEEYDNVVLAKLGRHLVYVPAVDPTCTEEGNVAYYYSTSAYEGTPCVCCHNEDGTPVYYGVKTVVMDTPFQPAPEMIKVDLTKVLDEVVIEALGHETVYVPAQEPTCLEDGHIAYYYCAREYEGKPCACCHDEEGNINYYPVIEVV